MNVLIVDDETPARRKVRDLLEREPDVRVIGEAADGADAVARIGADAPDVVFLDIQMPKLDGFDVIEAIGLDRMPLVVFVTAFDEHAVRAFEVQALDYLLKPFSPKRFSQVLDRVRERIAAPTSVQLARQLQQALLSIQPPRYVSQLLVEKGRDREVLLRLDTVTRIVADGNYLRFLAGDGEYLRRGVLSEIESRLDPEKFLRINRSELVKLDAVAEFQPWFHGDYRVKMKDGTVLTWSRRYRARGSPGT
jgi:two-component system, LytTR family, response regulator